MVWAYNFGSFEMMPNIIKLRSETIQNYGQCWLEILTILILVVKGDSYCLSTGTAVGLTNQQ